MLSKSAVHCTSVRVSGTSLGYAGDNGTVVRAAVREANSCLHRAKHLESIQSGQARKREERREEARRVENKSGRSKGKTNDTHFGHAGEGESFTCRAATLAQPVFADEVLVPRHECKQRLMMLTRHKVE